MPWNAEEFKNKHNKKLSGIQAKKAADIANAVLKRTGDEGQAVRVANAQVRKGKSSSKKKS